MTALYNFLTICTPSVYGFSFFFQVHLGYLFLLDGIEIVYFHQYLKVKH